MGSSSGDERSLEQPAIESAPDSEALEANSLGAAESLEAVVTLMRESVSRSTKVEFDSVFDFMREAFVELRRPVVQLLQEYLDGLGGLEFGSLDANKEFMISFRSLLSDLGVDVACMKAGCERPGKPRVGKTNSPHGSFGVKHASKPVQVHGSSARLPRYLLIDD